MNLITGGTGLVGAHLLYHLIKKGESCRAIFRTNTSIAIAKEIFSFYPDGLQLFEHVQWVEGDVLDVASLEMAMQEVHFVYHCAAVVSFHHKDRELLLKTNVEGTANVVNISLQTGIKKFCFVSSIASFGRAKRNDMVTEKTDWDSNGNPSTYSVSKYLAEQEVWRAAEEGLKVVIVNPSAILGSGNWHKGSSALFKKVWNGLSYYTEGTNGFVDVVDVVQCMLLLMESETVHERYLLVGENRTFKQLFDRMADELGKKRPRINVNSFWAKLACWEESIRCTLTGSYPLITKETAQIALDHQRYSNEKVVNALGFRFTPLNETVRRVAKDLRKSFT
jgi:dihydroflavonol-4-reductase